MGYVEDHGPMANATAYCHGCKTFYPMETTHRCGGEHWVEGEPASEPVEAKGVVSPRGHQSPHVLPETWEDGLDAVLAEMRDIMLARQAKYSRTNIEQQGLYGVLTRAAADKVSRIMGALNGRVVRGVVELDDIANDEDETFEDGCLDAANYFGPIALMLRRGWWSLPYGPEMQSLTGTLA